MEKALAFCSGVIAIKPRQVANELEFAYENHLKIDLPINQRFQRNF